MSELILLLCIRLVSLVREVITLPRTLDGPIVTPRHPVLGIGRPNTLVAPTLVTLPNTVTSLGKPQNPVNSAPVSHFAFLGASLIVATALLKAEV